MKASSGFNLIELMVTITIITLLMAIGLPSYRSVTTSNRLSSEINGLLGDLQYARAEAIKEGQTVTVCSATSDSTGCSNTADWTNGWIVFSDPTNTGVVDTGEAILRVQPALPSGDTLKDTSSTLKAATFNRMGLSVGMPAAGLTLTLHDRTSTTGWTRCLAIDAAGMLTTQNHATATGCT